LVPERIFRRIVVSGEESSSMKRVALVAAVWFAFWIVVGSVVGGLTGGHGGGVQNGIYFGAFNGAWWALFTSFAWPWIMPERLDRWMHSSAE
jgi:hypothetical protein